VLAAAPTKGVRLVLDAQTAADLMTPNAMSIRESATARDAARFLTARGVSAAPVINEAGLPVGVVSQSDLVIHAREKHEYLVSTCDCDFFCDDEPALAAPGRNDLVVESADDPARVRDLMTPTVFSVRRDAPAVRVVEDLLTLKVHRLFVTDAAGVLVGVISARDVLSRLRPGA
jgi:CBS-domain-containing membrane protein